MRRPHAVAGVTLTIGRCHRAVADRSRKSLRRGLRRRLVPCGEQCGHPSTEQSVVGSGNGVMRRNSGSIGNSTCEPSASVSKNWPASTRLDWPVKLSTCTARSDEHTSELQSLMRISYAVFGLKKNNNKTQI